MPWKNFPKAVQTRRWFLIKYLGGHCSICKSKRNLELHHLYGTTWDYRKVNQMTRVKKFEQEAKQGLLCVLCGTCNKREGRPMQWE